MQVGSSESSSSGGSEKVRERLEKLRRKKAQTKQATEAIVKNIACPSCREKGGDKTGNHLMVFESGSGFCNRCTKSFTAEVVKALESEGRPSRHAQRYGGGQGGYQPPKKTTIKDVEFFGFTGDQRRRLAPATDQHFGIRTETSTSTGTPLRRYYPYYLENDLYGYKVRELPKDWKPDVGTIKGTDLFGWHLCTGKKRVLIITEGEEDAGAAWQLQKALNKRSDSSRIKNLNPHVVSLPNGAKGAAKALLRHYDDLMMYDRIYWFGDNIEEDVEGAAALEAAVQVLGAKKLYVPVYPKCTVKSEDGTESVKVLKDPCDVLKQGGSEAIDLWATMYFEAKLYKPADIVEGQDFSLEEIEQEVVQGIPLPFLPSADELLQGLRLYEHTLIFSGSGMGKSTICRALGHYVADTHDWLVGNIYLEEKKDKTAQGYIAYHNKVSLTKYRKDFNSIPYEGRVEAKEKIIDKMFFLNHNGCIDPDVLMNKIRYLYNKGCKLIILDHISMAVNGSDDERKSIDYLMGEIYDFCENNPIHVISVVHLNRGDGKSDFERGAEIRTNNLRGSSGLLQMCWNALAVEGDNQHPEYATYRFLRWLKVRETGEVGLAKGAYKFDRDTGRYSYTEDVTRDEIGYGRPSNGYQQQKPDMGNPSGGGKYDNKAV